MLPEVLCYIGCCSMCVCIILPTPTLAEGPGGSCPLFFFHRGGRVSGWGGCCSEVSPICSQLSTQCLYPQMVYRLLCHNTYVLYCSASMLCVKSFVGVWYFWQFAVALGERLGHIKQKCSGALCSSVGCLLWTCFWWIKIFAMPLTNKSLC